MSVRRQHNRLLRAGEAESGSDEDGDEAALLADLERVERELGLSPPPPPAAAQTDTQTDTHTDTQAGGDEDGRGDAHRWAAD